MMDFGALPPEINSGRIYAGPGSASMLAAAAAWDGLAGELHSVASSYGSSIAGLTSGPWQGPSAAALTGASAPYAEWMSATAALADRAAAQARAAAAAYQSAYSMTVPPAVIAANRARLMMLTATNFFGQNSPAIAATEAVYGEMWAQDAGAMYDYAGNSASASTLSPFDSPPQTTNQAGVAAQGAAVAQATGNTATQQASPLSQLITSVPATLQQLSTPSAAAASAASGTSGTSSILTPFGTLLSNSSDSEELLAILPGYLSTGVTPLYGLSSVLGMAQTLQGLLNSSAWSAGSAAAGAANAASALGAAGSSGVGALGSLGQAASLGPLSVPPAWTAAAVPGSILSSANGALPGAVPAGSSGTTPSVLGGVPRGLAAASSPNGVGPRYGIQPTVMSRPPSAGYGPTI